MILTLGPLSLPAAADDAKTAREHELLHRAQQQLQQSQAENAELQHGKNDAEAKLKAQSAELEALRGSEKTARSHSSTIESELRKTKASQSDLGARLDEANRQLATVTLKQKETSASLAQRESELAQVSGELAKSNKDNVDCEAKNMQLYEYGDFLLQRYKDEGVWGALARKEPVFGLKQVDVENVVQEYRDKLAAQKLHKQP